MSVNYIYQQPPAAASLQRMECGVGWLYMPLPFALDHVNLWVIGADTDTSLLIDTGINSAKTKEFWSTIFETVPRPDRLLVTHYHPDHAGLSHWFQENYDTEVFMSAKELALVEAAFSESDESFSGLQKAWYQQQGLGGQQLEDSAIEGNSYRAIVSGIPAVKNILCNGQTIEAGDTQWTIITGGGHSPEQIALYSPDLNVLVAADQILPKITPNISLSWYKKDSDPLAEFLASFSSFEHLPEDVVVLPSHGLPFTGLHQRMAVLEAHHKERLEALLGATATEKTPAELLPVLFTRELDPRQMMFAMGECVAHLRYLQNRGELQLNHHDEQDFYQRSA